MSTADVLLGGGGGGGGGTAAHLRLLFPYSKDSTLSKFLEQRKVPQISYFPERIFKELMILISKT